MFPLPNPLHPAVVHFPIVLLLIGTGAAVVSVAVHRWHLAWISAVLLAMGAVGAWVAVETGEEARELVGVLSREALALIDSHQEWAERTELAAFVAALFAVLTAALESAALLCQPPGWERFRWLFRPATHSALRTLTTLAALLACFFVYQTARRGGEAVYEHGVGVTAAVHGN